MSQSSFPRQCHASIEFDCLEVPSHLCLKLLLHLDWVFSLCHSTSLVPVRIIGGLGKEQVELNAGEGLLRAQLLIDLDLNFMSFCGFSK
mmetsp:Transcript_25643/g.42964  ORF Transcript_25643/g.42964 Transcript_25643/m.42964 type:complete len:89 (-) Transcript_25643:51-317(-)